VNKYISNIIYISIFFILNYNNTFAQQKYTLKRDTLWQNKNVFSLYYDTIFEKNYTLYPDTLVQIRKTYDIHTDTIIIDGNVTLHEDTLVENKKIFDIHFDTIFNKQPNYLGRYTLRKPYKFFENSKELNKPRIGFIAGFNGGMYIAANAWWSSAWYSKYNKSKFHFFNDWKGWYQIDKIAHGFNAYFISDWSYNMFRWTGIKEKNAIWIGMLNAQMWMLSIEINDGLQKKWGFSWGDIAFNLSGSLFFGVQQYLWHEQRFRLKISAFPQKYAADLKPRTNDLFGTSFTELILKDYNATTFWLSVSPGAFIKKENAKFPKWIMASFGYGGQNMLGGSENKWCKNATSDDDISNCDPANVIDRTDIERYRQFYISADIDWTKIPVKRKWAKTCLGIINIIKLPFPAIEFNTSSTQKVKWRWLMF
jgi:hypothetical protein